MNEKNKSKKKLSPPADTEMSVLKPDEYQATCKRSYTTAESDSKTLPPPPAHATPHWQGWLEVQELYLEIQITYLRLPMFQNLAPWQRCELTVHIAEPDGSTHPLGR